MTFTDKLPHQLPAFMNDIVARSQNHVDADMLVLSSLTAISACLPNIEGKYARRRVYPNLFLMLAAPPSAGKGRIMLARRIVAPVHNLLRQIYHTKVHQLEEENKDKKQKHDLTQVPQTMLFIPANSSSTAIYQTLHDCDGSGLIFESEADTLSTALSTDYGNFSDGLRKAFHHESISYNRRKDREYVEINNPRLSLLLAGTPRQLFNLIPNTENGLFSRFMIYSPHVDNKWIDVFDGGEDIDDEDYFNALGNRFFYLYNMLRNADHSAQFQLTPEQQQLFNSTFERWQEELSQFFGAQITPSVRRLGLITFRIAMIFTTLRLEFTCQQLATRTLTCNDQDFENAIFIVESLLDHLASIFTLMPDANDNEHESNAILPIITSIYQQLPQNFSFTNVLPITQSLGIPRATVYRYLTILIQHKKISRIKYNTYEKN